MGFPAYQPAPGIPAQAPIDLGPLQKILTAAPNTKGLAKTAAAQASQQVNSQLAAIQAAQQGELQQAAGRAREINAASLAGSNYLDSLGFAERLRAALQQAGQDQAAFAQGFSGDLRQTAEADAAKVNQSIAAIGGTGSVPNADALANTVYGLGRIPADVLTSSAPYVYAQAQTLPASLLAAGREQAVGALGAGQQAAAQYRPQIAAAIGSLPKLSREILSDLTTAAEKARQDAIGHMFEALKLQQAGRSEEATQAWRNAQLQGDQWKTYLDAINRHQDLVDTRNYHNQSLEADRVYHDQLAQGRADTLAETQAYHAATLAQPDWTTVSDAKGTYLIDRKDGRKIRVAGPQQSAVTAQAAAKPTFNATNSNAQGYRSDQFGNAILNKQGRPTLMPSWRWDKHGNPVKKTGATSGGTFNATLVTGVADDLRDWHTGITGTSDGVPVVDENSKLNWLQAYTRAVTRGPSTSAWAKKAKQLVSAEFGSPLSIASGIVSADKQSGSTLMEAIANVIEAQAAGQLPVPASDALAALAQVYGVSRKLVVRYLNDIQSGTVAQHGSPAYG